MANLSRNFTKGVMDKELDERLVSNGVYTDATNVRINSSEGSEGGVVENAKGNELLYSIEFDSHLGITLDNITCIGSYEDGSNNDLYWFVTCEANLPTTVQRIDFILSHNTKTSITNYHVISTSDPLDASRTSLNFHPRKLITGVNLVDDLLFFTDGHNEPRKINVNRSYPRPLLANSYVDTVSEDEFMVLKKFPNSAPTVTGQVSLKSDDFLEDKFISFAYRYKYSDGEYSATSQFSQPVFFPKSFKLSHATNLNEGARNLYNAAKIEYNSGSSDVIGVDILFKEMANNNIKVIENINKKAKGLIDDSNYSVTFDGNKVYTFLPESEILRLYDNVPRTAQAQTVMSNRLIYGNYLEGYDMKDSDGNQVRTEFDSYLKKEDFGYSDLGSTTSVGVYSISGVNKSIDNSKINIDFTGVTLSEGDVISLSLSLDAREATGAISVPGGSDTALTGLSIDWTYQLRNNYACINDLANSSDFKDKIGNVDNIKPVYHATQETSCSGGTLTDIINCAIPTNNGDHFKTASGITNTGQGVIVTSSNTSELLSLHIPAMKYVDDLVTPTEDGYLFFDITSRDAQLIKGSGGQSLHSSRGYELGMVYMDKYGRSSNALVSSDGGCRTDAYDSITQNTLAVSIPATQKAPSWASRYKLVLKQDKGDYETIYSSTYVRDINTPYTYFMLEGENAAKVEAGDILIVKRDAMGSMTRTVKVTVLDKTVEEAGFVSTIDANGNSFEAPVGVYAKVNASDFSTLHDSDSVINISVEDGLSNGWGNTDAQNHPVAEFGPFGTIDSDNVFTPYPIAAGSSVDLKFNFSRKGSGDGDKNCERRTYELDKTITASRNYSNFWDWWEGDNVSNILNDGSPFVGGSDNPDINNEVPYPGYILAPTEDIPVSEDTNHFQLKYTTTSTDSKIKLFVSGARACGASDKKQSEVTGSISINKLNSEIVFETEPVSNNEEIWFENEESFSIINGLHSGNVQSQTSTLPTLIDTSFFNCYTFGNGVESYKVRDSIIGNKLTLGNRVHSTQAKEYKAADRFADLTYSGVYNDESNINRLNEFNGGLLNFKPLEDSFGRIGIIDARKTDILVLQEDKVSVVLAGKNLLSMTDATSGGALLSVPDVLGSQLARDEEYGISNNPESYASFGNLKYFTDSKRGCVLQLNGDALSVISDLGMSSFFRDSFTEDSDTFKHGGFDPYMKEYVLSNTTTSIEDEVIDLDCGAEMSVSLDAGEVLSIRINHLPLIGSFDTIVSTQDASSSFVFSTAYNSISSSSVTGTGVSTETISTDKTSDIINTSTLTLLSNTESVYNIKLPCVVREPLTVIPMVLTDRGSLGLTTHVSFRAASSPSINTPVTFGTSDSNVVTSSYEVYEGYEGVDTIPAGGDTVYMNVNSSKEDTFDYVVANHDLHSLRSDTLYSANDGLTALTDSDTILLTDAFVQPKPNGAVVAQGSFTLADNNKPYLYLIYDLRTSSSIQSSFGATASAACCDIQCAPGSIGVYKIGNRGLINTVISYTDFLGASQSVVHPPGYSQSLFAIGYPTSSVSSSDISITLTSCIT